jgi:adenylate kinase
VVSLLAKCAQPGVRQHSSHGDFSAHLQGRSDDTEPVIRYRLAVYHEVTHRIVDWYASRGILVSVDAVRPVERIARQILTALEARRPLVDLVPEHARRSIDLTRLGAAFGRAEPGEPGTDGDQ